jgi:predicted mannosyl-3-phosphoglycerate phosphatase (HAD superfamily)
MLTEQDIEDIKRNAAIAELKTVIQDKRHFIEHHVWSDFVRGTQFTRLTEVLDKVEEVISDMRFLLYELQKMEPDNE